jgi:hypothetical protein
MGFTEYTTDGDKNKLLINTINSICNRINEDPSQNGPSLVTQFSQSVDFSRFKRKIMATKKSDDIYEKRTMAFQAMHLWNFGLKFTGTRFELLSQYVLLLRAILRNFDHHLHDIWRKEDGAFMLYNLTPDRFFKREGDLKPLLLRMNALCARQYEDVV